MKCFSAARWLSAFLIGLQWAVISGANAQVVSGGEVLNNYELLTSVGNKLIEKVIKRSELPEKAKVILKPGEQDSLNWFVEKRLSSYLINEGYNVYANPGDSLSNDTIADYVIQFSTIDLGINYEAEYNTDSGIARTGFLTVDFNITGQETNRVLLNDIITESKTDRIELKEIKDLEDQKIDFTVGKMKKGAPTVRFKPLIITAVTGTIVYLFYSLRSR